MSQRVRRRPLPSPERSPLYERQPLRLIYSSRNSTTPSRPLKAPAITTTLESIHQDLVRLLQLKPTHVGYIAQRVRALVDDAERRAREEAEMAQACLRRANDSQD
jgi:hypothetical protein